MLTFCVMNSIIGVAAATIRLSFSDCLLNFLNCQKVETQASEQFWRLFKKTCQPPSFLRTTDAY